jgi:hypothetical protein
MHGVTDDNADYAETASKSGQGAEVFAGAALAFQGQNGLGGEA